MQYPILFDGEERGELEVREEGLMTVFEARCADPGHLVRLSVYGDGEGYLGVMAPRAGKLHLQKRLSRLAMRDFPRGITHAGPAGVAVDGFERIVPAPKAETPEPAETDAPAETEAADEPEPVRESQAKSEPPHTREEGTDLLWYSAPDGSLTTTWQGRTYLAIPTAVEGLPMFRSLERREIDGGMYVIFETKNGIII